MEKKNTLIPNLDYQLGKAGNCLGLVDLPGPGPRFTV